MGQRGGVVGGVGRNVARGGWGRAAGAMPHLRQCGAVGQRGRAVGRVGRHVGVAGGGVLPLKMSISPARFHLPMPALIVTLDVYDVPLHINPCCLSCNILLAGSNISLHQDQVPHYNVTDWYKYCWPDGRLPSGRWAAAGNDLLATNRYHPRVLDSKALLT